MIHHQANLEPLNISEFLLTIGLFQRLLTQKVSKNSEMFSGSKLA
jgi:hypothetical protein